jgi:hypothetical protein
MFFSVTATERSGSPSMVLSLAVICRPSVRHLPALLFVLEPVPAVVP